MCIVLFIGFIFLAYSYYKLRDIDISKCDLDKCEIVLGYTALLGMLLVVASLLFNLVYFLFYLIKSW